ncbi:high affinity methionine permease [Pholiota molesta]|nr:high affinity methionine permease [Pholiota molesta]
MSSEDEKLSTVRNEKGSYVVESASEDDLHFEDAAVTNGAPIEKISPLGYHVDWVAVVFLNVSKMIGTVVFTTPGAILKGVGSVGLSLIFWVIGYIFAAASLSVYLEYATYFPHRSGAEVAYLEKAFPKPKFLLPTVFAVQSVLLSFSSSNAIVLANYLLVAAGTPQTTWNVRGVAVGVFTGIVIICIASTRWSIRLSNAIGLVKVLTLIFIAITGLVVLGGIPASKTRMPTSGTLLLEQPPTEMDCHSSRQSQFRLCRIRERLQCAERSSKSYKDNEAIRAPLADDCLHPLLLRQHRVFAAIPKESIRTSNQLTASLFFTAVFGNSKAVTALSVLVAVSSFGNMLAVIIGSSRIIRECGRQGVLPYPRFWASTWPFNTPLGPYLLKWILTVIVIIAPPAGDAFNFRLFWVRRRRQSIGAPKTEFRAWNVVLVFALAVNVYLLVLPWVPPTSGIYAGDVSFFYATYCIVGLGILAVSGLAYVFVVLLLPKWGNYTIRQFLEKLPDGAQATRLVKVPNAELADWDATHNEHGEVIARKD